MGRGKSKKTSTSAYADSKNDNIKNTSFRPMKPNGAEDSAKHSESFYRKLMFNSSNRCILTRNTNRVTELGARDKFLRLVRRYESDNSLKLADTSKTELMFRVLDFIETNNSIIYTKDDSRQFLPYRMEVPNVFRLYLYKLLYTRIFDFIEQGDNIVFSSAYIEKDFESIFRQVEKLISCLCYDALIVAMDELCYESIDALKNYDADIVLTDNTESICEYLTDEFTSSSDMRVRLMKKFIPSIVFSAKYYEAVYKARKIDVKKITTLLNLTHYRGSRAADSRMALISAVQKCADIINSKAEPFERMMNFYFINRRLNLMDMIMLKENAGFKPYLFDGILVKSHLDRIIRDNGKNITCSKEPGLSPASVYNNPNCIISNINSRDYEMLDTVIKCAANSMSAYYLQDNEQNRITPFVVCKIIEYLNGIAQVGEFNDLLYMPTVYDIDKADYELVTAANLITPQDN